MLSRRDEVDLNLLISYAELDDTMRIDIDCAGAPYNPFEQEEGSLNVTILKNTSKQLDYRYEDNRSRITINI